MDTPTTSHATVVASPLAEPDPLLEPFRAELVRLTEQPFTVDAARRALPKLKRTIEAAWLALGLRDAKRRAGRMRSMNVCVPGDMNEWDDPDDGPSTGPMGPGVVVPYTNTLQYNSAPYLGGSMQDRETFGATAIREVVAALRPSTRSVTEIVKAIAEARANKLDDVAAELMQQLRDASAPPPDPAMLQAAITDAAKSVAQEMPPPPLPPGVMASSTMASVTMEGA